MTKQEEWAAVQSQLDAVRAEWMVAHDVVSMAEDLYCRGVVDDPERAWTRARSWANHPTTRRAKAELEHLGSVGDALRARRAQLDAELAAESGAESGAAPAGETPPPAGETTTPAGEATTPA